MRIRRRALDEQGQTMAEYAVIGAVIVPVVVVVLNIFAGSVGRAIARAADLIPK